MKVLKYCTRNDLIAQWIILIPDKAAKQFHIEDCVYECFNVLFFSFVRSSMIIENFCMLVRIML